MYVNLFLFFKMSCLLSKLSSVKSKVQLRNLSVPTENLFARKSFNQPSRYQNRFQSHASTLFKPTVFCISVSSGAIVLAAIIQYERFQSNANIHSKLQNLYSISKFGQQKTGIISDLKSRWNNLKPYEKIFGTILVLNSLVFLAWQVPRWQHIMVKYFSTDALASKIPVSSLLLSAFSHSSPTHLAFNMYALFTFCRGVIYPWGELGPEEFTALYISSCVVSSLVSIVFRRSMKSPGISLGASGAILSVVGYFALSHPDEKLSVIFLPMIQFDAIYALFGLVTMDSLGILLQWKVFDHAAHLGGTLFGMFWYKYMSKYVWGNRRYIVRNWIALKKLIDVQSRK